MLILTTANLCCFECRACLSLRFHQSIRLLFFHFSLERHIHIHTLTQAPRDKSVYFDAGFSTCHTFWVYLTIFFMKSCRLPSFGGGKLYAHIRISQHTLIHSYTHTDTHAYIYLDQH